MNLPIDPDILMKDLSLTFLRWVIGWLLGGVMGLSLATLTENQFGREVRLHIPLHFLRSIPVLGLIPFIQIMIGVHEPAKIGLISWAVTFPVWLAVSSAVARRLPEPALMLQATQMGKWPEFRLFVLPRLIGGLFSGLEIGIGVGWLSVVAAEWIGTLTSGFWSGGLGYRLIVEYEANDWAGVLLILLIFGSLGIATSQAWNFLLRRLFERKHAAFNPIHWVKSG